MFQLLRETGISAFLGDSSASEGILESSEPACGELVEGVEPVEPFLLFYSFTLSNIIFSAASISFLN